MEIEKNRWMKCISNFRFHSIFLKNLLLIFCALVIPFICVLGISVYTYGNIHESEAKAYSDKMVAKIVADVDDMFQEIREKAIMLSIHQDVRAFFFSKDIDRDEFYDLNNIFEYLSLYSVTNEIIESVYLYSTSSHVVISQAGRYRYDDFYDKECVGLWDADGEMYQIHYLERAIGKKNKETLSFYYAGIYGGEEKAAVIININMNKLHKYLDYGEDIEIVIEKADQVLYDSSKGEQHSDRGGSEEDRKDILVIREELEQNAMEIILKMNSSILGKRLNDIKTFIVFFICTMVVLTLMVVIYISKKLYDPISEILNALKSEEPSDKEDKILQSKDELNYIMDSIYATTTKSKDVEKELSERIVLLKKAQAIALQSQINPHFMYNTLETINWMAIGQLGESNVISEMIDSLSHLLRVSLEDTGTLVTVKEEMEYAEQYLFIQQKRFRNKFVVIWNVPEEIQKCRIVKMVFQPVLENAITYGIKPHGGRGQLKVEAWQEEKEIHISIWNSGMGLTADEVTEINGSMKDNVIKESDHLGLSNVNQRIRLTFGEAYGVNIASVFGEGTTVTLKVPYQV